MEKQLLQWSYWLGVACVAVAIVWRAANAIAGIPTDLHLAGKEVTYWTVIHGAILFLLVAIATANYDWGKRQS